MNPRVRTFLTHVGTAAGATVATAMWLATKSVDMYAVIDQFNTVVVEVSKLVALATPLATMAYGVWNSSTAQKMIDVAKDTEFKGAVVSPELAAAVPSDKVVASVEDLPTAAKAT